MKAKKRITLIIAMLLVFIIALTVMGCKKPSGGDPQNQVTGKDVSALKAQLLSFSGYSEDITAEGAKFDLKDQAISLSSINNFCNIIAESQLSQEKINNLATIGFPFISNADFSEIEDLFTEDDVAIIFNAFFKAQVETYSNPSLFNDAKNAANTYVNSFPAEKKESYANYVKFYILNKKLEENQKINYVQADFDGAIALVQAAGLTGTTTKTDPLEDQYGSLMQAVEDAMNTEENTIRAKEDPVRTAAYNKIQAHNKFGSFKDWKNELYFDKQTVDSTTLTWLNDWLKAIKKIAPDTQITIPTAVAGLTDEWKDSVEKELNKILWDLGIINRDYYYYAKVAYQAEKMDLTSDEIGIFTPSIQEKLQQMPDFSKVLYKVSKLYSNERLWEITIGGKFETLSATEANSMLESIKENLQYFKTFANNNEAKLKALRNELNNLLKNHTGVDHIMSFYISQYVSEGIDILINFIPSATTFFIDTLEPVTPAIINGIFDSLDAKDVEVQMNAGIYYAKMINALLEKYPEANGLAQAIKELLFDKTTGFLHANVAYKLNTIITKNPMPETITEKMKTNFALYTNLYQKACALKTDVHPEVVTAIKTLLGEDFKANITYYSDKTQVEAFREAVNTEISKLANDETAGTKKTALLVITSGLEHNQYAMFKFKPQGSEETAFETLAKCKPVTSAEDENYPALAKAMTDILNNLIENGAIEEYTTQIGKPGGPTVEDVFASITATKEVGEEGGGGEEDIPAHFKNATLITDTQNVTFTFKEGADNTQWIKFVATKTGKTEFAIEGGHLADVCSPKGYGVDDDYRPQSLSHYAGMTYYIKCFTISDGNISIEVTTPIAYPDVA